MHRDPIIRSAIASDAPALAELSGQLGYPVSVDGLAARLEYLIGRTDQAVLVACTEDGRVIGWTHGSERTLLESERDCEILGLVVDQSFRRHGAGRKLVAALEKWATGRGRRVITVRSNVARPESHPFYEGLGFTRTKTQHVYRKPLSPTA